MNNKKDNLFMSFFILITEQLLIFPISFTLLTLLNVRGVYSALLFIAFVLMLVRTFVTGLKRSITVLIFTFVILAYSLIWSGMSWNALLIAALGLLIEFRALSLLEHPFGSVNLYSLVAVGLIGYPISALYYNNGILKPYIGTLGVCAALSAIFACICMNMALVGYEKNVGNRTGNLPRISKKSNRLILTVFILLILFLSSLGFADTIYTFLGYLIKAVITGLIYFFSSLYTPADSSGNSQEPAITPEIDEGRQSPFWFILEKAFTYLSTITILLVVLFLVYSLIRYLTRHYKVILQRIWSRISVFIRTLLLGKGSPELIDLGYEDEISSLINKNESMLSATRRWLKSRSREGRPYVLLKDNVQRARWLYSHIIQKGIKKGRIFERALTPGQILKKSEKIKGHQDLDKAISCYNEARYGTTSPADSGVEALKSIYRSQ